MNVKGPNKDDEERAFLLPKSRLIRRKTDFLLILSMLLLYLLSKCVYSTIGPIYTIDARVKGTTTIINGLVFAIYPFVIANMSPIVEKYLPKLGQIKTLFIGSFLEGFGGILFGFILLLPDQLMFVLFSFLLRAVIAVGGAFSRTAFISILSSHYPDHNSILIDVLELASCIGLMLGPLVGGVLYSIAGFELPFVVTGASVWLILGIVLLALPLDDFHVVTNKEHAISIKKLIKVPELAIIGMCTVTAGACISFYESTIAIQLDHITKGEFSRAQMGAYFIIPTVFYTVSAPLWGYIVEHKIPGKCTVVIGHVLLIVTFILMGPVPFLQEVITATPLSTAISLCLLGISLGPYLAYVTDTMKMYAIELGLENNLLQSGIVTRLFSSYFFVGSMIGPIIGGLLIQNLTFSWTCLVLMSTLCIEGIILVIYVSYDIYQAPNACQRNSIVNERTIP